MTRCLGKNGTVLEQLLQSSSACSHSDCWHHAWTQSSVGWAHVFGCILLNDPNLKSFAPLLYCSIVVKTEILCHNLGVKWKQDAWRRAIEEVRQLLSFFIRQSWERILHRCANKRLYKHIWNQLRGEFLTWVSWWEAGRWFRCLRERKSEVVSC